MPGLTKGEASFQSLTASLEGPDTALGETTPPEVSKCVSARGLVHRPRALLLPGAQQAADEHQFAQMVGIVVGDEQCLPQNRLSVTVGDRFEKVR